MLYGWLARSNRPGGVQKWLTLYAVRFDEMGVVSIRFVRGVVLAVISCGLT